MVLKFDLVHNSVTSINGSVCSLQLYIHSTFLPNINTISNIIIQIIGQKKIKTKNLLNSVLFFVSNIYTQYLLYVL